MGRGELDEERRFLNKWEMHKALDGEELGPCRLPETHLHGREALAEMLARYDSVYIKPVDTWGGRGISRVEREGKGEDKGEGERWCWTVQGEPMQTFTNFEELAKAMSPFDEKGVCIVQQTAPLMTHGASQFDIRVHMQRDLDGTWVYAGELVRVSGADSIVSNVAISGGAVQPLAAVVGETFDVSELKERLQEIGFRVCEALEAYRVFTEIGVDLGIAPDGQLWLIEVNTDDAISGPSHELFEHLPDKTYANAMRERFQARRMGMFQALFEWVQELDEED
ncbi:MAG TPA: YheC/YheD family protein [Bacilli bacterium]|nr:YheC/YheD family protein [Bacilli bacterium]